MSSRHPRLPALGLVLTVLLAGLAASPATAGEPTPVPPVAAAVAAADDQPAAVAALEEVRNLVGDDASVDATIALRDLAMRQASLPAGQAREAAGYLARPTDGDADPFDAGYTTAEAPPACSAVVCVHYVRTTRDRVPAADSDENGVPDFVDFALTTQTTVHQTYVGAGYRAPKGDGSRGGDPRTDIYLADVGDVQLYGYCASDDRLRPSEKGVSAFCVLDNDFAREQFPSNTPRENYRVTAAHEYFHAVQFGYDFFEDSWFMEATATWAEDELYDSVDDNVQYLSFSPLARPRLSMDQFLDTFHYGTWIFFRYLTEQLTAEEGGMATLVRDMWRRADDSGDRDGDYSLMAIKRVLGQRDTSLVEEFALFSQANRMPALRYEEGRANRYPRAPAAARLAITTKAVAQRRNVGLDHLSSATVLVTPASSFTARAWRLRVRLDLSPTRRGTAAVLTVVPRTGAPRTTLVRLDADGDALRGLRFSSSEVRRIEVTLVSANSQFRCTGETSFSCGGQPLGDDLVQQVRVRAFRAS